MSAQRKSTNTKERLLQAAQALMLSKGFTATSVEDVCGASGLTKGSFFHYFDSKEALAAEVLQRFCDEAGRRQRAAAAKEPDPLKRIFAALDAAANVSCKACSCLLGTFAQEVSETHPGLRAACAKGFDGWARTLAAEFEQAATSRGTRVPVDARSLADHVIAVLEGGLILAKARQRPAIVKQQVEHVKRYLSSLFK